MEEDFILRTIEKKTDKAFVGFADLYIRTFSEFPFCQKISQKHIRYLWEEYQKYCLVVVELRNVVVGFGCFCPLLSSVSKNVADYILGIRNCPFEPSLTVYMASRAIVTEYQRKGLGTTIAKSGLKWAHLNGFEYFLARTVEKGSLSIGTYKKLRATNLGIIQEKRDGSKRIYYWGRIKNSIPLDNYRSFQSPQEG